MSLTLRPAEPQALTKGNVSQRLIALEKAGLLRRRPDRDDARVVHLVPTARAQALLGALSPPPAWRTAMAAADDQAGGLEAGLTALLSALQSANGRRTFGQCRSCRFLQHKDGAFTCGLTLDPLEPDHTLRLCREHEPAA